MFYYRSLSPDERIDTFIKLIDDHYCTEHLGKVDGVPVSYLSRADFITKKLAVGRPKDLADVDAGREIDQSAE